MSLTKQLCRSTLHWTVETNFYLELQRSFWVVTSVPMTLLINSTNCWTEEPQLQPLTASRIHQEDVNPGILWKNGEHLLSLEVVSVPPLYLYLYMWIECKPVISAVVIPGTFKKNKRAPCFSQQNTV